MGMSGVLLPPDVADMSGQHIKGGVNDEIEQYNSAQAFYISLLYTNMLFDSGPRHLQGQTSETSASFLIRNRCVFSPLSLPHLTQYLAVRTWSLLYPLHIDCSTFVFRLLAIGLELPEETLANVHQFREGNESAGKDVNAVMER